MKQLIQNTHTTACILSVAALLLGGCTQDEALPGGKTETEVNTRVTGDDVPVTITPPLRAPPSFDFVARWFQDGEFPCSILFSVQRASLLSQSIHSTPTAFLYFLFITPHRPYIEKHGERQQRY